MPLPELTGVLSASTDTAGDPVRAAAAVADLAIARAADDPCTGPGGDPVPTDGHPADRAFPEAILDDLHREGLLLAPLARALGGAGLGLEGGTRRALLETLAEVGRADLSAGRLYEGHVDALLTLQRFGTPAQQARAARHVRRGGVFGVWNTGPATGGVRLTPTTDGVRLAGGKTFASGAARLDTALVTGALPDGGWQMCLVPVAALRRTGAARVDRASWRPPGMLGSASYAISFDDARLPGRTLLGSSGDYYAQPRFTGGAVRFAAVQLGGAERLVDELRTFLRATDRGGDPYQLARLGEATTLVAGGRAWLHAAAEGQERYAAIPAPSEADIAGVVMHANMTRTAILDLCTRLCPLVERSVGARGLLAPHAFAHVLGDLTMYLRQPAPDAAVADVGRYALDHSDRAGRLWTR